LKALIFDVDATLANTEQDGHLRAFKGAFKLLNIDWHWDNAIYKDLLQVTGGKEPIAHYMSHHSPSVKEPISEADIVKIHQLKNRYFCDLCCRKLCFS